MTRRGIEMINGLIRCIAASEKFTSWLVNVLQNDPKYEYKVYGKDDARKDLPLKNLLNCNFKLAQMLKDRNVYDEDSLDKVYGLVIARSEFTNIFHTINLSRIEYVYNPSSGFPLKSEDGRRVQSVMSHIDGYWQYVEYALKDNLCYCHYDKIKVPINAIKKLFFGPITDRRGRQFLLMINRIISSLERLRPIVSRVNDPKLKCPYDLESDVLLAGVIMGMHSIKESLNWALNIPMRYSPTFEQTKILNLMKYVLNSFRIAIKPHLTTIEQRKYASVLKMDPIRK